MKALGVAALALVGAATSASSADTFRHLKGTEIRSRFPGMEVSDGVHYTFTFRRDGVLAIISAGAERTGRSSIEDDRLCLDRPIDGRQCFEVWAEGRRVELRRGDAPPEEGVLRRPARPDRETPRAGS